jgi:hypothetical protein
MSSRASLWANLSVEGPYKKNDSNWEMESWKSENSLGGLCGPPPEKFCIFEPLGLDFRHL